MLQPTSLAELKKVAQKVNGEVIEIPGFGTTDTLKVRVRQVSLLELSQCDILPNPLLIAVNDIIQRQGKGEVLQGKEAAQAKMNMAAFTEVVYKAALVEPTYEDFKNEGLELNLIQKRMIAEYSIGDTTTYSRFRKFRDDYESNLASQNLSQAAERDNGNIK